MTLGTGAEAPLFELEETRPEGREARCDLQGLLARGPALVIFAKSSCPTCQWCLPLLDRLHQNYGQQGASVVLVLQDSVADACRFREDYQIRMPILVEPEPFTVSESYGVEFVPTSFWISADGVIQQTIEAFERLGFEEANRSLAEAAKREVQPLFGAEEGIPAFRPG